MEKFGSLHNVTLFDVLVVPEYVDLPQRRVMGRTLGTGSIEGGLLGHPADPVLHVLKNKLSYSNEKLMPCEIYYKAKQTRDPFPFSDHKTKEIGELVHLDLWGPYKVFNKNIKTVRSDNGTESLNTTLSSFFRTKGIVHQTSCAYTLQQNGVVERKHRHLLNVASVLNVKSPYEIIYGREPSLSHLRVFGCLCFATKLNNNDKFGTRADKCVFVGYSNVQKGYKLYNLDTKLMTFSRDVKFYEQVFPFKMSSNITSDMVLGLDHLNFFDNLEDPYDDKIKTDKSDGNGKSALGSSSTKSTNSPSSNTEHDLYGNKRSDAGGSNDSVLLKDDGNDQNTTSANTDDPKATHVDIVGYISNSEGSSSIEPASFLRRSCRVTNLPKRFEDFVINEKVKFGVEKVVNYLNLLTGNFCFVSMLNKIVEPKHYFEAAKDSRWVEAMNSEIEALPRNNTWIVTDLHQIGNQ
ncbi:uncharacterized protein [Rutidosis leptorrhynchoides]|uniref:uncharacterized protein n=1 Tax=Rutidosis leptorrhynchoides TaxID=125765 RepID=UPI003A992DC8